MPGYIKNVGDHIRMRWVQPGYDPDATDVPPNKVIFDSDDVGTVSILTSGTVTVPTGTKSAYVQLVEWDYPFVPLCLIMWATTDGYLTPCTNPGATATGYINIRKTGIYYKGTVIGTLPMNYTAFNVWAADG